MLRLALWQAEVQFLQGLTRTRAKGGSHEQGCITFPYPVSAHLTTISPDDIPIASTTEIELRTGNTWSTII